MKPSSAMALVAAGVRSAARTLVNASALTSAAARRLGYVLFSTASSNLGTRRSAPLSAGGERQHGLVELLSHRPLHQTQERAEH